MHSAARCALLATCLPVAVACRDTPADPAILTLQGEVVRRSEFEAHVRKLEARDGAPLEAQVRAAVLEPFLEERLLVIEARRRRLLAPGADEAAEQNAVRSLLQDQVLAHIAVDEADVEAYFAEHHAEFRLPERRTLRQVLVDTDNQARDARRRIERDPKSFELVARSQSRGPEAAAGGLMGSFAPGELPAELESVAFSLAVGVLSPVIQSPLGYHVLRVEVLEPPRERQLEECRHEIRKLLLRRRSDEGVRQLVRALWARAKVNHEAALLAPRQS